MAHIKQKCDFCNEPAIVDGKTVMGPWSYMCSKHFEKYGVKSAGLFKVLEQTAHETSKTCTICGKTKPIGSFYKYTDKAGVVRYRNECKKCNLSARKLIRFKKG